MLALSLNDKFCYFGIFVFVFVFNRFLFFRFSFVFVFIIFSFSLTNSLFSRFSTFSFSFSLTKITLIGGYATKSVRHGQHNARPTVTFPATERNHSLVDTKVY